jgi:hypothetical protein
MVWPLLECTLAVQIIGPPEPEIGGLFAEAPIDSVNVFGLLHLSDLAPKRFNSYPGHPSARACGRGLLVLSSPKAYRWTRACVSAAAELDSD